MEEHVRKREVTEILEDIESEISGFDREELLQYAKWSVSKLYNSLRNEEKLEVKCKHEIIDKLCNEKEKYRLDKNIDHISVQYAELFDNIKTDDKMLIKIYMSIYFYDDVDNNENNNLIGDKYWNDIWIVTYLEGDELNKYNSNCANCGAIMEYNREEEAFECEYCGNTIHKNSDSKWEIVDIEIMG